MLESELINVRQALLESGSCNPCFVITQANSPFFQYHLSTAREAGLAKIGLVRSNLSLRKQLRYLCSAILRAFGL